MYKKDIIEFLMGQKGNKQVSLMEEMKYDKVIQFIEQREKYFDILKTIFEILFRD